MGAAVPRRAGVWSSPEALVQDANARCPGGAPLKLYLIRHARGVPRSEWTGHDELRPLSARGRDESLRLADALAEDPPTRLLSGPALRCQQTLEPLAVDHAIPLEVDERLAQGESAERVLELLPTLDEGPLALCTHADVIESLLSVLELWAPGEDGVTCCRKGAYWELEGSGYTPSRARYLEPGGRTKRTQDTRPSGPRTFRGAALDLGSTSFNLLIADVRGDGRITPVIREKMMLRLGAVIANGGKLVRPHLVRGAPGMEPVSLGIKPSTIAAVMPPTGMFRRSPKYCCSARCISS